MEATEANLDIKVTQLKMSIGKTNTIVETGKSEAIERHLSTLWSLSKELNQMRIEVEAAFCPSKSVCQQCHKHHHTSICDAPRQETNQPTPTTGVALTTNQVGEGLFPVLVVEVNGIKCRVLIDSGAGSSYVSAKLIDLLCVKPSAVGTKSIDMLMSTKVAAFEV